MQKLIKENIQKTSTNSSRSIKKLLKQRSLVVVISIVFTGLGASITSIFFKTGIYLTLSGSFGQATIGCVTLDRLISIISS